MKNCDEMVNSLLERRDRYNAEKKRKRSIIIRTVSSMCCVCLVALLGIGVWKGGLFNTTVPGPTPDTSGESRNNDDKNTAANTEQNDESDSAGQETNMTEEVKYIIMGISGDWPVYKNVKELTDAGNVIVTGKITDISFEFTNPYLYTNYSIEVITSYKGDAGNTLDLRLMGGIEGAYIDEQKAALGDRADEGIPLTEGRPDLKIGQTYLFVLHRYENAKATLVSPEQGAFNIDDPLAKDIFSFVSANDIISFFEKENTTVPELTTDTSGESRNNDDKNTAANTEQNDESDSAGQETNMTEEVKYIIMGISGDWPVYKNVKELTDAGNVIVTGKITDIFFEFTNPYLYTNYSIEVITSYKGDAGNTLDLRLMGGIEGAYIDEQKAALGDRADEGIPLTEGRPDLKIGQTYLFVLHRYENAKATLVSPEQGAFNIDDPLAKDVFSFISANDIISFFEEEK